MCEERTVTFALVVKDRTWNAIETKPEDDEALLTYARCSWFDD